MTTNEPAKLSVIMDFFNPKGPDGKRAQGISQFNKEWQSLSPKDQDDLRHGFGNGSLTYA